MPSLVSRATSGQSDLRSKTGSSEKLITSVEEQLHAVIYFAVHLIGDETFHFLLLLLF